MDHHHHHHQNHHRHHYHHVPGQILHYLTFNDFVSSLWFICFWRDSPHWARASSFRGFLDHIQRRTTVGRTPLDEWSVWRRDLYLTTHNIQYGQTSMLPVGFEPTISAGERPQTYALDRAATGSGHRCNGLTKCLCLLGIYVTTLFRPYLVIHCYSLLLSTVNSAL
jgi:hypothetical protein